MFYTITPSVGVWKPNQVVEISSQLTNQCQTSRDVGGDSRVPKSSKFQVSYMVSSFRPHISYGGILQSSLPRSYAFVHGDPVFGLIGSKDIHLQLACKYCLWLFLRTDLRLEGIQYPRSCHVGHSVTLSTKEISVLFALSSLNKPLSLSHITCRLSIACHSQLSN